MREECRRIKAFIDLTYRSRYNCETCPTRCDDTSKGKYSFQDNLRFSEEAEEELLKRLSQTLKLAVKKTPPNKHTFPDLQILSNNQVVARIEVKAQRRAFMKIEKILPKSDLKPYEAVALNLSDLIRYFKIYDKEQIPIFIVWKVQRPCIGEGWWGESIDKLRDLYNRYRNRRRFRRRSTQSNYVDGEHKGVTVNYHFSLRELSPLEVIERELQKIELSVSKGG